MSSYYDYHCYLPNRAFSYMSKEVFPAIIVLPAPSPVYTHLLSNTILCGFTSPTQVIQVTDSFLSAIPSTLFFSLKFFPLPSATDSTTIHVLNSSVPAF